MAKQVEDIVVRLVGEGFEALDKIKGSFRELGKVTNLAEKDILSARDSLLDFAKKAGNTEAVNKGLTDAFKGLRSQVDLNSGAYRSLTTEIAQLETAQRGSTAAIDRQRTALLSNAAAGKQNAAAIEQQIQGLTRLQQQTRPGSSAFLQLGKDIDTARANLGRFKSEAAAFSATLNQIPGASLDTLGRQIGRLTQGMQTLKIASDEYLNTQQRISLLGEVRGRTTGRQQVRAANQMFESTQFQSFAASRAGNLELPETLAGIQQRVGEINAELQNVSGYTRRRSLTIELAQLNRQLKSSIVDVVTQENLAVDAVRRRVNASREINQASGFGAFSSQVAGGEFDPAITTSIRRARERLERENDRLRAAAAEAIQISRTPLLPAAGQTSAPGTGGLISGGARRLRGQVETTFGAGVDAAGNTPRAPWQQNYLPNAAVGTAPGVGFAAGAAQAFDNLGRSTDRARRPLRDIFAELERVRGASNGSVNSLQAQISAWTQIRSAVSSSAPVFATATKQIEALSRQQARLEVGRRGPSTGQLVQAGGAAISGGIFGGPEGFLGGVGGAVLGTALPGIGTAGGAFAGAAAGAQVGMFRQQLAGTADYAASIGKLQIALRGVVGSQAAYDEAIRSAAAATRDLNIPQEEATRGLTRLSAAVIGAGGTVADSSFAFRAMSEAIKATGGNAEQVDGALLALTQVFSKGKVSAEELNQIAERLPGTFTLFAQAAGKTGPELQKALEQGEVGLNDLMKFLALTGERFGTTAAAISGSSQDAGARLTVAFQAMRLEVGKALQPLGAELQGAFAKFITEITPAVVSSAKALAAAISFFADNKAAAGLATFAFQVGAVALAIKGLQAASAGLVALNIASWFTGAATGIKITGDAAAVAAPKVGLLRGALGGLVALAAKPIVITIVIAGVIEAIKRIGDVNTAFAEFLKTRKELTGGSWLSSVGGGALSTKELSGLATEVSNAYNFNAAELKRLEQQKSIIELQQNTDATSGAELAALNNRLIAVNTGIETAKKRMASAKTKLDAIYGQLNAPKPAAATTGTNFPDPTGGEDKDKTARDKARRDAEAAAADQQRYLESFMQQQIRVADTVFQHQQDLDRQRFDLLRELTDIEAQNRINKLFGPEREAANIQERRRQRTLEYENRILAAMNAVAAAQQRFSSTQQMAAVTAGAALPSGTGAPSIGGFTPQQLSSATAAASKFTGIAKMCSEAVKAFYTSLGITLPGVTAWADTVRKSGQVMTDWSKLQAGDIVATGRPGDTPHVGVYTGGNNVFHQSRKRGLTAGNYPDLDYFKSGYFVRPTAAAGRQPTGVAAQQRRNVTDTGDVALAGLELKQAQATLANLTDPKIKKGINALFDDEQITALTGTLNTQNNELEKTIALETKRFDLAFKGYSEERIALEQKLDLAKIERDAALTGVSPDNESAVLAINAAYERQVELLQELNTIQYAPGAKIRAFIGDARRELDDLQAVAIRVSQGIGDAVGNSLANGISGLIEGTVSAKQVFATFLRDIGQMLVQEGTKMIATYIAIGIAKIFAGMGGGGGGSAAAKLGSNPNVAAYSSFANGGAFANGTAAYAKGGTFARNSIVPYAKGGTFTNSVVSSPTLFKFAAGGTTRTGLMGEAGPEAIMPLKRGADGRLGVAQVRAPSGGDTRMREMMGRSPAQQTAPVLNMTFQSTSINGVEYVSRDQLEQAMAQTRRQSTRDGAQRGMTMTLDKLQQSPSTRSRVGMR